MPGDHILSRYDEELTRLNGAIIAMGGLAERQIRGAIRAVTLCDEALAAEIVEKDAEVDDLEQQVEAQVNLLLALQQPVANDLRVIVSALKISGNLERICDYAANIAKRTPVLDHGLRAGTGPALSRMAELAQGQIESVVRAYTARDAEKALLVWRADEELDDIYTSLFRELLTYMMEDPRAIAPGTHLLFIAKNIERIGDHVTNIAEAIFFLVHGTQITLARPKRDRTASTVVLPKDAGNA